MKYWDKILGILLLTLMVVMVSGCISVNHENGEGFTVSGANTPIGEGYEYTFDSGNTCSVAIVDVGYGFDTLSAIGTSSKYCVPTVESDGTIFFEINGTKVGGITDILGCTPDEINKAITDVLNKQK